jgi:putative membrane protein
MERNFKDYALISLKGIAMGAADVVPGVSGGTIAFISGIYEELVTTISGINLGLLKEWREFGFSSMWKKANGNFIIALFLGIAISVFTVMRLANYLLENHPILIWSFFFGLVIASIWFVGKQIPKWNAKIITALVLGAAVAFYITTLPPITGTQSPFFLFIAGAIAVCAMILPGISGAFILVLLGAYKTISEAIHDFDFKTIGIVAVGAVVGLLSFSRVLKWLFLKYKAVTLAVLTGFITGSLNKIWPWKEILETVTVGEKDMVIREQSVLPQHFDGDPQLIFALLLMVAGFLLILILERVATQQANA